MKKTLIALLAVPFFAFAIADWVNVQLDERASISFPVAPEIKDFGGNQVWVSDASDSQSRYMMMIMDFSKFGLDSAGVAAEMGKEETFDQFKGGVLGQIPGASLISEKKTTVMGKMTFDYVIDMGKKDPKGYSIMYNRNIFSGAKMYSMNFYEKKDAPKEDLRKKFFESFQIK